MSDTAVMEMILGALAIFSIVGIVYYVLMVIAQWKIFTKAGEAGWKSIIPFLNAYVLYKISWKPMMFWILLALAVIEGIFATLAENSVFALVMTYIFMIAIWVIDIIKNVKLSKAYGHGVGFAVGLILLNPIFMLILGLGNSKYVGKEN